VAENLLQQNFEADRPNQKWVSDITYIATDEGWLYLAVVMDLYSRAVLGWSMSERMTVQLTGDALRMALFRRHRPGGVIVHSDRGSQYCAHEYQALLRDHGLICSMSGRGNCYDNAAMESWNHSLKVEAVHGRTIYHTRHRPITGVRLHRGLLQSTAATLKAGLQKVRQSSSYPMSPKQVFRGCGEGSTIYDGDAKIAEYTSPNMVIDRPESFSDRHVVGTRLLYRVSGNTAELDAGHAFIFSGGVLTDINSQLPPLTFSSQLHSVNDHGRAVRIKIVERIQLMRMALPTGIALLPGGSNAFGVNNVGQATGWVIQEGLWLAFLYTPAFCELARDDDRPWTFWMQIIGTPKESAIQ